MIRNRLQRVRSLCGAPREPNHHKDSEIPPELSELPMYYYGKSPAGSNNNSLRPLLPLYTRIRSALYTLLSIFGLYNASNILARVPFSLACATAEHDSAVCKALAWRLSLPVTWCLWFLCAAYALRCTGRWENSFFRVAFALWGIVACVVLVAGDWGGEVWGDKFFGQPEWAAAVWRLGAQSP